MAILISTAWWTFNRQTQIKTSKSQQRQKHTRVNSAEKDGDGEDLSLLTKTESEEVDESEDLYFNDYTLSSHRENLLANMTVENEIETDDSDDDDDSGSKELTQSSNLDSIALKENILKVKNGDQQKEIHAALFKSISKLKVFSYLSDGAFLMCLSMMEHIHLEKAGTDLFADDDFDGSLYIVMEGKVNFSCALSSSLPGKEEVNLTAGKGDILTSLLSTLASLVQVYQEKEQLNDSTMFPSKSKIHTINVTAKATADNTKLIKIPKNSLYLLLKSYPRDIHVIAQTILARSQRVTIQTLVKNLGLGFDILYSHGKNPIPNRESFQEFTTSLQKKVRLEEIANKVKETSTDQYGCMRVGDELMEATASVIANSLGSKESESDVIDIIKNSSSVIVVPPGEVLVSANVKSDYLYFVLDGVIEVVSEKTIEQGVKTNIYSHNDEDDAYRLLYNVFAGDFVGAMSCFTDELSFVTWRSGKTQPATLFRVPKETFRALVDTHSDILMNCVAKILTVDFSPLVHLFDWGIEWMHIQAGTSLIKKNELCTKMHVVLSGRLQAAKTPGRIASRAMTNREDEFGRGACIGETLVLIGEKYAHDIFAVRNSELAVVPLNILEYVMHVFPQTAVYFAKQIATRKIKHKNKKATVTRSFATNSPMDLTVATISVVPLCFDSKEKATNFTNSISDGLQKLAPCTLVTKPFIQESIGKVNFNLQNAFQEMKLSRLLGEIEESHRLTLYQADNKLDWWTKICIQQSDCVLLVVDASSAPSCDHLERYLSWASKKSLIRYCQVLVLQEVEEDGSSRMPICKELSEWIDRSNFLEGQHILRVQQSLNIQSSTSYEKDVARMCRRITGRSLGLALGGGGARGLAHIGIIKVLMEKGITVDITGGTSQGAFISALFAKNPDSYEMVENSCRQMADMMASKKEKILDLTLPIVSYFNGSRFNQGIKDCIGENTNITDLVLNYFCVSTDLNHCARVIHTKGPCWKYVRASMSLHGYLPPIAEKGRLLVDGGYTNVVPGDILHHDFSAKAVIAVDVSKQDDNDFYEYGTSLSGLWLLLNSLNPFKETVRVQSMGDLSQRLIWVSSVNHRSEIMNSVDLFLTPPVGEYGTLEYDKFDEIVNIGYKYALSKIDAFIEENPWVVS
ncbi:patatin-domain-containing protein [Chaetoceros tenuissimus]|uniref:Patatin-domain-containing protein n=1 Tax=Chaetoceros tenuissimus TaxID=426638 RepID=A0AAD3H527_9STRA|nr:patatin-domain-containing protein [Chaetoceros tenuissimus]